MVATASIKMDELLTSWLGSDNIYENVMRIIETYKNENLNAKSGSSSTDGNVGTASGNKPPRSPSSGRKSLEGEDEATKTKTRPEIPPFFRRVSFDDSSEGTADGTTDIADDASLPPAPPQRRRSTSFAEDQTWDGVFIAAMSAAKDAKEDKSAADLDPAAESSEAGAANSTPGAANSTAGTPNPAQSIAQRAEALFLELGTTAEAAAPVNPTNPSEGALSPDAVATLRAMANNDPFHTVSDDLRYVPVERFERLTKELCLFPTFFHKPLYERILLLWDNFVRSGDYRATKQHKTPPAAPVVVTFGMFHWFWEREMAPYDMNERFFRLLKQPDKDYIARDDFFPYIKELLNDHPGLEFLSNHAEFQDKYAVTVITRIFYSVNLCHSGRITSRQIRKSNLLQVFQQVDEEEDINKVTRYFSYEHFYVLYCRFWELDHDRDYRITREDLLKYGEHSLSHMIVDRIFDAAPRPFESSDPTLDEHGNALSHRASREYLSYEDFIFFMLSEEDKSNECSVRYWFTCVDVDGDDKLNNMEMRSFYAVQLHRMQCMGHEVVPFEDMLCQMMDMIKPSHEEYLVVEDFLQPACSQVSGALFDALFNVNKYVMFEQRDPFLERQKREDEFETDWDRFACIDYNRLAMEEEAREEEAMEIDWATVDDEDEDGEDYNSLGLSGSSEAPF